MAVARRLTRSRRRVETRSRAMERLVKAWLLRYAKRVLSEEMPRRSKIKKADTDDPALKELRELLRKFGLRHLRGASKSVAGVDPGTRGKLIDEFLESKAIRVKGIAAELRSGVVSGIRETIREALGETPIPSAGEIARRLRAKYSGKGDVPFEISSERAALISRTELAQAENTGILAGYAETGVTHIEWLSYSDGRSGDRHHERMNGKTVRLGEKFTTPLGNKLRYPGDPRGPIKETANCRCTVAPATSKKRSKK